MMAAIAQLCRQESRGCQVSVETVMACGIGACLGCVVETKEKDGTTMYKRVCKEGPVFDIREIVWNR
jgi:dihydroorotate dehydrogenase electron transfer subunit